MTMLTKEEKIAILKELIIGYHTFVITDDTRKMLKLSKQWLSELDSDEDGWHNTINSLPKNNDTVLVLYDRLIRKQVKALLWYDAESEKWQDDNKEFPYQTITHWRTIQPPVK